MAVRLKQKPITLDAIQWQSNEAEVRAFVEDDNNLRFKDEGLEVWNNSNRSWESCPIFHYIVKGKKGEFFVISPDTLERGYAIVSE